MNSEIPKSVLDQIKTVKELDSNEIQNKILKLNKNCIIEDFDNNVRIAYVDGNFYKTESFYGDGCLIKNKNGLEIKEPYDFSELEILDIYKLAEDDDKQNIFIANEDGKLYLFLPYININVENEKLIVNYEKYIFPFSRDSINFADGYSYYNEKNLEIMQKFIDCPNFQDIDNWHVVLEMCISIMENHNCYLFLKENELLANIKSEKDFDLYVLLFDNYFLQELNNDEINILLLQIKDLIDLLDDNNCEIFTVNELIDIINNAESDKEDISKQIILEKYYKFILKEISCFGYLGDKNPFILTENYWIQF
jgi:hypothetical protein